MAKTAIITGGSRGIGKALSLKLGEMGYKDDMCKMLVKE